MRIGSGSTIEAAPTSQQPWIAVTRPRLVGDRIATWSPGLDAAGLEGGADDPGLLVELRPRAPAPDRGGSTNVTTPPGRFAARSRRVVMGTGGAVIGRSSGARAFGQVRLRDEPGERRIVAERVKHYVLRMAADEAPRFRYTAALAGEIEARWQDRWEREHTFEAPNPAGPLADPHERRRSPEALRARHVPLPVRRRACTSATRSGTSAPTSTAATSA